MDGRAFLSVHEDIEFIRAYLNIQNYRYTGSFQYYIKESSDCDEYLVPKLMVQPLVENSLKHGLKNKISDGVLRIQYITDNNILNIIVEDNGCGMTDERINETLSIYQSTNAGHIGLRNIQERIHLYFGNEYGIEIISQPNLFTRFELTLPLIKVYDEKRYKNVQNTNRR